VSPREPTLSTLLVDAIQSRLLDLHVMLPAKVTKYNAQHGTVDVKLLLKNQRPQPDGSVTLKDFPPVQDVPVAWPRCGKAWLTMPLADGDTGMVIFADRNLSNWAASNKGETVDPKDLGMHNLSGAVFLPGLTPTSSPIDSPSTDHTVLHTESELHLGEKELSDDNFVALSKAVMDNFNALLDAITNAGVAAQDGGATFKTNLIAALATFPTPVAATKVKAK
jgi:hypothetical protein